MKNKLKLKPKPMRPLKMVGPKGFTHICEACQCGGFGDASELVYCLDRECPEFNGTEEKIETYNLVLSLA